MTTLADLPWPLATADLRIRPARADDAAAVWQYLHLPEVRRWMWSVADDPGKHAEQFAASAEHMLVVARSEEPDAVIGHLTLKPASVDWDGSGTPSSRTALGWALDPAWHGRGYATQALDALLSIAFDGLGLAEVVAFCSPANVPSRAMMERAGMRGDYLAGSTNGPLVFRLTAETWRDHREPAAG